VYPDVSLRCTQAIESRYARIELNDATAASCRIKSLEKSVQSWHRCLVFLRSIAVGTVIADRPPHRPVRAELPHTVLTADVDTQISRLHVHPAIRATWLRTVSRPPSGSMSGPVATARCSPWSVPFPPPTPQALAPGPCSLVSSVLWNCLTPR
jgi:hypothetical protein